MAEVSTAVKEGDRIQIQLLGPLTMSCGDVEMAPVARKPRQILALLLLNYSQVVSPATLIDELWDGCAPRTARAAVQIYVLELRKKLAAVTGLSMEVIGDEVLRTVRGGYEFVGERTQFDLRTFRQLERLGMASLAEGDLIAAAESFRKALLLWRGPPLDGVDPGPRIRAEVAGLEQSRATMLDRRIKLDLRLGRHQEILGELTDLVLHDRFNEDLHAQFILALYRSGDRVRALQAFHRFRKEMVGRFGLEPSLRLHQYRTVLTAAPELDESALTSESGDPLPR